MSLAAVAGLIGCANPGPPRPPSLHLPAPVRSFTAERTGDSVRLHFVLPQRTTDDVPLREREVGLRVCRELEHTACLEVSGAPARVALKDTAGRPNGITLALPLTGQFVSGPPRLLGYRVELLNSRGRSAGPSEAAYTVAGSAPAPVRGLRAQGSRLGVVLSWEAAGGAPGETIYFRRQVEGASKANPGKAASVLLRPEPGSAAGSNRLLDTSAAEDVPYLYSAFRERRVTLGGRSLTERGQENAPVAFTLRDIYPPPPPADLTAAPVLPEPGSSRAYAVDLIWGPVEDPALLGYNVYREPLGGQNGQPATPRQKLNSSPITEPAFHDTTAQPSLGYRWTVTAVDRKGNESTGASAVLEPSSF